MNWRRFGFIFLIIFILFGVVVMIGDVKSPPIVIIASGRITSCSAHPSEIIRVCHHAGSLNTVHSGAIAIGILTARVRSQAEDQLLMAVFQTETA